MQGVTKFLRPFGSSRFSKLASSRQLTRGSWAFLTLLQKVGLSDIELGLSDMELEKVCCSLGKAQWLPASGAYLYINLLPGLEAAQGFMYDGRQR